MLRIVTVCALLVGVWSVQGFSQESSQGILVPLPAPRTEANQSREARREARRIEKEEIIEQIILTAQEYGVKPYEALAIAQIESGFHPRVLRWEPKLHTYSMGLFQLLIPTAKNTLGYVGHNRDLLRSEINIPLGIQYISMCYQVNKVSTLDLACCYQAGLYASERVCHRNSMVRKYAAMLRSLKSQWYAYLKLLNDNGAEDVYAQTASR
jgi:hypothetical protein